MFAMYQQEPVENYGAYFHEEWIRTYRMQPEAFEKVYLTADFVLGSDYYLCWGKTISLRSEWEGKVRTQKILYFSGTVGRRWVYVEKHAIWWVSYKICAGNGTWRLYYSVVRRRTR